MAISTSSPGAVRWTNTARPSGRRPTRTSGRVSPPKGPEDSVRTNSSGTISGSASNGRQCVAGAAANVHALGWVPAGTAYTVTFDSDIPLVTAVARIDLAGSRDAVTRIWPGSICESR